MFTTKKFCVIKQDSSSNGGWYDVLWLLLSGCPSQSIMDNVIVAKELQVERKHFYIEFRENERGRFMRITEEAHGRRNTIIIPSTGLEEFMASAGEVIQSADRVPAHG